MTKSTSKYNLKLHIQMKANIQRKRQHFRTKPTLQTLLQYHQCSIHQKSQKKLLVGHSGLVFNRGQKNYSHLSERQLSTFNLQKDFENLAKQKAERSRRRLFIAARFDHYVISIDLSETLSFLEVYSKKLGPELEKGIR